jgi:arginine exporter protein ArgO
MKLLKTPAVVFGLIMTALTAGCLIIMEVTGKNQTLDSKSFLQTMYQIGTPLLVWYFGIRARRSRQKGKLTYKQGFQEGMKITLTYVLTSPFVFLLYYTVINPEFVNYARTVYHLPSSPAAVVIATDLGMAAVIALLFGTLYSAIFPLFLKKKK